MNYATFKSWLSNECGATLIEYSLLVALLSVAIVLAIMAISGSLGSVWSTLASIFAQAAG